VMEWDCKNGVFVGHFEAVFTGVPCTEYSRLREYCKKSPDIEKVNEVVLRTLEIIDYFKPMVWFIENPDGGKLKDQEFMKGLLYYRLSHCVCGYENRKTTRSWTNVPDFCEETLGTRHLASMGQKKYVSPAEKYSFPPVVVRGILGSMRS
jgi:hypothetical protein